MTANPKTTCAAMGCTRWTRRFPPRSVYLCPAHWRMVPKKLRRLQTASVRKLERDTGDHAYNRRRAWRIWDKCVAAADRNFGMPT